MVAQAVPGKDAEGTVCAGEGSSGGDSAWRSRWWPSHACSGHGSDLHGGSGAASGFRHDQGVLGGGEGEVEMVVLEERKARMNMLTRLIKKR